MKFAMVLFWLLMILWLIGGFVWSERSVKGLGSSLLPWACIALLGRMQSGNPFDK